MKNDPLIGGVAAVLFDLDGTLLDHDAAVREALRGWLPTIGLQADQGLLAHWFEADQRYLAQWHTGRISWVEQRRKRLLEVLPSVVLGTTEDDLDSVFAGYVGAYEKSWRAFSDVAEALGELDRRGYRLGVLTNGGSIQQRAKLVTIGLSDRFEFILTGEDLGTSKPDPVVYLSACDRFDLAPHRVLHVGDVFDLDVSGARSAGLHAVLIDRQDLHHRPDSLRALTELPALVEALSD